MYPVENLRWYHEIVFIFLFFYLLIVCWKHYHVIASLQGIGAVVGVLHHNLADLQDLQQCQGSYISIYDQPSYVHQVSLESYYMHYNVNPLMFSYSSCVFSEEKSSIGMLKLCINYQPLHKLEFMLMIKFPPLQHS